MGSTDTQSMVGSRIQGWRAAICVVAMCGGCSEFEGLPLPPVESDAASRACGPDLADELGRLRVPGLAAGVLRRGDLSCVATAGFADVATARRVERGTIFQWASVSKTVTATAAMILVDEGRLDLDDGVGAYVPFEPESPHCPGVPISTRHLLTHTSSIIDNDAAYDGGYVEGDSPVELGAFVGDYLRRGGAHYDADRNFHEQCPGETWEYSNVAVGLLGHVVEGASGVPFDRFCRERIFAPLGMDATSFRLGDLDVASVATPHEGDAHWGFEPVPHVGFPTYPDGLLRTSVPHMARFLSMMANAGEYEGTRILSEARALDMRRPHVPDIDPTQGLIWFYDFDGRLLGHDGADDGTSSLMFFDPATGNGALLVANGYWYDEDDDAPEAYDLLERLIATAAEG